MDYGVWGMRGDPNRIRGGGGRFTRPQNFTYGVGMRITKYMVSNQANHMTNYKENVMQVTCTPRSELETQGTLTLSMVVTVPQLNNRSRIKTVTLARYHYVSKDDATELKAKFLRSNDELIPDFVTAKWEYVAYL